MAEETTQTKTEESTSPQANKGGVVSRSALYLKAANHADNAIAVLVELMNNKDVQASVRVSAAGKILDKVLPDLKASELTGADGGAMKHEVDIKSEFAKKIKEIFADDGKPTSTTTTQDARTE